MLVSTSQLSYMTGLDRATVRKHLAGLAPYAENQKLKLYYAPIAIPLLLSRSHGKRVDWPEIVCNLMNTGALKPEFKTKTNPKN
jgi:hypothetical protein